MSPRCALSLIQQHDSKEVKETVKWKGGDITFCGKLLNGILPCSQRVITTIHGQCLCTLWTVCLSLQKSMCRDLFWQLLWNKIATDLKRISLLWDWSSFFGITQLLEVVSSILLHTVSYGEVISEEPSLLWPPGSQPYGAAWVINTSSSTKFPHLSLCAGVWPDPDIVKVGEKKLSHLILKNV